MEGEVLGAHVAELWVKAIVAIECDQGRHVLLCQRKVKHVEILLDAVRAHALGDDTYAAVDLESNEDLRRRLAVLVRDSDKSGVLQQDGVVWLRRRTIGRAKWTVGRQHHACRHV